MRVALVVGGALAFGAAWARAASGEAGQGAGDEGLWALVKHAINLAILAYLLVRFALPALRSFLRERSEKLRDQITAAQRALEAAQRELRQLRAQLARSDEDARELMREAERMAQAEQEQGLQRARDNAQRLAEDARRIADQEIARARALLQAEAAALATELAAGMLRERLGPEDDRRIFDEFVQRVGSAS